MLIFPLCDSSDSSEDFTLLFVFLVLSKDRIHSLLPQLSECKGCRHVKSGKMAHLSFIEITGQKLGWNK